METWGILGRLTLLWRQLEQLESLELHSQGEKDRACQRAMASMLLTVDWRRGGQARVTEAHHMITPTRTGSALLMPSHDRAKPDQS